MDSKRPPALPRRKAESQTERLVDELFGDLDGALGSKSGSHSGQSFGAESSRYDTRRAAVSYPPPAVPYPYSYPWSSAGDRPQFLLAGDRYLFARWQLNWYVAIGVGAVVLAAGVTWWSYVHVPRRLAASQPAESVVMAENPVSSRPSAAIVEQPTSPLPSMFESSIDLSELATVPDRSVRTRSRQRTRSGRSPDLDSPVPEIEAAPEEPPVPAPPVAAAAPSPPSVPPPPPAPVYTATPPASAPLPDVQLVGVMGVGSPDPSALIMVGNAMKSVAVGEPVQSGWAIAAIDEAGVHVSNGSQSFSLQLGLGSSL